MSLLNDLWSSVRQMKWQLAVAAVLGCQAFASAAFVSVPRTGVSVLLPDTVDPVGSFSPDFYNIDNRTPDDGFVDVILNLGSPVTIDKLTFQNRASATTNAVPWIFSVAVGDGVDDGIDFGGGLGQYQIAQVNTAGHTHAGVDLPDGFAPKQYYRFRILRTINGDSGSQLNSQIGDFLYEAAVPEPATLSLVAMGIPMFLRRQIR